MPPFSANVLSAKPLARQPLTQDCFSRFTPHGGRLLRPSTYAGILAHGTSLTAAECARMIPQLSATSIRQAMRWAGDERRLAQACEAVLEFMQRHPIAASGDAPIWPRRT